MRRKPKGTTRRFLPKTASWSSEKKRLGKLELYLHRWAEVDYQSGKISPEAVAFALQTLTGFQYHTLNPTARLQPSPSDVSFTFL
jgi:hypothetical protein